LIGKKGQKTRRERIKRHGSWEDFATNNQEPFGNKSPRKVSHLTWGGDENWEIAERKFKRGKQLGREGRSSASFKGKRAGEDREGQSLTNEETSISIFRKGQEKTRVKKAQVEPTIIYEGEKGNVQIRKRAGAGSRGETPAIKREKKVRMKKLGSGSRKNS